jgi:flagellar biosynthesis protein
MNSVDSPADKAIPDSPQKAIALFYDGKQTPKVSAIGEDALAEEIVRIAKEAGVPLYENAALVRSLAGLQLGDEIPELLYRAIAEVIAFAYMVRGKTPEGFGGNPSVSNYEP